MYGQYFCRYPYGEIGKKKLKESAHLGALSFMTVVWPSLLLGPVWPDRFDPSEFLFSFELTYSAFKSIDPVF